MLYRRYNVLFFWHSHTKQRQRDSQRWCIISCQFNSSRGEWMSERMKRKSLDFANQFLFVSVDSSFPATWKFICHILLLHRLAVCCNCLQGRKEKEKTFVAVDFRLSKQTIISAAEKSPYLLFIYLLGQFVPSSLRHHIAAQCLQQWIQLNFSFKMLMWNWND